MNKAKDMRVAARYTRSQVAEYMGVSPRTIQYWETEDDSLRLDTAVQLCVLYGCTLEQIAGIDDADSEKHRAACFGDGLTEVERARVEGFVAGMRAAKGDDGR